VLLTIFTQGERLLLCTIPEQTPDREKGFCESLRKKGKAPRARHNTGFLFSPLCPRHFQSQSAMKKKKRCSSLPLDAVMKKSRGVAMNNQREDEMKNDS
jgi:hypothetical protein